MGLTKVSFRDYALGCFGFIPGTVAYVFIGTSASHLLGGEDNDDMDKDGGNKTVQQIVIVVGVIATIIAIVLISVYAKQALSEALKDVEEDGIEGEDKVLRLVTTEVKSTSPMEVDDPVCSQVVRNGIEILLFVLENSRYYVIFQVL
ncbi:unnamed protein product [Choristocarpus tenellus]